MTGRCRLCYWGLEENLIKSRNIPVVILPELIETGPHPCDTGSPTHTLIKEFKDHPSLDFSPLKAQPEWNIKAGRWAYSQMALSERARYCREWLRNRKEKNIVVVSHHGFLCYLIGRRPPEVSFPV